MSVVRPLLAACLVVALAFGAHGQNKNARNSDGDLPRSISGVDDTRLDRLIEAHVENDTIQSERAVYTIPVDQMQPPERRKPNGFIEWLAKVIASVLTAIGPLLGYLAIAALVAAGLAGLYFILRETIDLRLPGRRKNKAEADISEIDDQRPDEETAKALLEEADALAAAGRFAEAVHLLLFRSIQDIQERRGGSLSRSLTAREIGGLSSIPARVRSALSPIISQVEASFFGGREVDQRGWQSARNSYEQFAFGEAWT